MIAFYVCEDGQDIVEYALILALVIVVCAAGMTLLGNSISAMWTSADHRLSSDI